MPAMVLVLLGLLYINFVVMEECCSEKEVGNIRYELISKENTSAYGCESDCVYQQVGVPTERFCFKAGDLPFHCIEEFPEWMAVRIIPGGFDIARGHYVEHPIDTDYIHKLCNPNSKAITCNHTYPWRPISGECNNLNNPHWGAAGACYQRFIPNAYADPTNGTPRGGFNPSTLPSPRKISREFHIQLNRTVLHITNLFWQFGQYVGHDTGLTPEVNLDLSGGFNNTACASDPKYNTTKKCFNINVNNDTFYTPILPTYPWLGFARTLPHYTEEKPVREQVNAGTGFMDASITYGFSKNLSNQLRTKHSGLLINGTDNLLPIINDIKSANPNFSDPSVNVKNIAAGDPRVNMHPWLLSVQTMFFREHNRLAKEIYEVNGENDDELIFQNARQILIAEYQNIIFNEFIPLVIGNDTMKEYRLFTNNRSEYNETTNPTTHNGFQTAAARFGHSMIQNSIQLQKLTGPEAGEPLDHKLYVKNNFFNDSSYQNGSSYSEVLGGSSIGRCQHFDRHVEDAVTNFLYDVQGKNKYGDDLASRNIQRGRDHGLPGYMKYREFCGLSYGGQGDIDNPNWKLLMRIYENNPDDIDVWTGGLAETPSEGAIVGPLFQCLLGKQYHNLKYGDRFFFTHSNQIGSFTDAQLKMIRSRTMRDVICQNSDSPKIRMHAMEIRDDEELIDCTEQINQLNAVDFF